MTDRARLMDRMLRFRASAAKERAWKRAAAADGRSLSEWLRHLADRRIAEQRQERDDAQPER